MANTFEEASNKLDHVTKTNRAWDTRDSKTLRITFEVGETLDAIKLNEELSQKVAQMKMEFNL